MRNLIRKLNITGRKTNILLQMMSQDKSLPSYIDSGLEVSSLEENYVIPLPEVYIQKSMPVDTSNIPAKVELLIGSNTAKAIEPWEVINSQGDGPYAVKTLLRWEYLSWCCC